MQCNGAQSKTLNNPASFAVNNKTQQIQHFIHVHDQENICKHKRVNRDFLTDKKSNEGMKVN